MTKKSTKTALLTSSISLLLCFAMLLGTTFAWFTDSVTSANNVIKSGNLDVAMYWADGTTDPLSTTWTDASDVAIFNYDNWEPGYAQVRHIKIANEGTLALKYKVLIAANGTVTDLTDVIDVYYADPATQVANRADLVDGAKIGTLKEVLANLGQTGNGTLAAGENDTITIAFKMQESAGNEYQNKSIGSDFSVKVVATQLEAELDSFDNMYDKDAEYPNVNVVTVPAGATTESRLKMEEVTVVIPTTAGEGVYELQVVHTGTNTVDEKTTVSYDITLLKNGEKVSGVKYPVQINVGKYRAIEKLLHNGNEITEYDYDKTTGIISFETDSFSPFSVTHTPAEIECGIYDEDPALYFASQLGEDKEHISTEIKVGGEKKWNVSKTAATVFVEPSQSGTLYSVISALQNKEHSTVYLLPGTYNEATTINVYSSMDIIGLGDKDEVKVIKQSSSSSNRHLFNCSGTKADYIQVTIRNMYLDATAKTTNGKDNAAVQSIRKSKVKCYDLTIVKGSGWDDIAFYVNGNNAVDGVKYPAYLYAENCALNTAKDFSVLSTAGSYKFYHNNVTYNGTAYTKNSGSTLNQSMLANDWEW